MAQPWRIGGTVYGMPWWQWGLIIWAVGIVAIGTYLLPMLARASKLDEIERQHKRRFR